MSCRASFPMLLCALAAPWASGCTFTHRCPVPDPVVEAAPAQRAPLPVGVRYVPGAPAEVSRSNSQFHVWVVDAAPPTRALFDRLAASMFDPAVAGTGPRDGPTPLAAATLEVRLDEIDFHFVNAISGPYRASVAYHATLRDRDGAEIASFDAAGATERPIQWSLSTHCAGIGGAAAVAMQDAGAAFLRKFAADPAVAAWFAAQTIPLPAFTVRPAESYPAAVPAAAPSPPEGDALAASAPAPEPAPRPAPAPVGPGRAMPPRTFQLRVGVGTFTGEVTGGRLEDAQRGLSAVVGAEYRPARALGVELEAAVMHRGYSPRTLPPGGPFAVPRGLYLDTRMFGVGVRAILPGRAIEPWVGTTGHLMRTEVCAEYSLFGVPGCSEGGGAAWSAGFDVGAGLAVFPGRWLLGLEVRRLFARANLDPFPGSASVGGVGASFTFGGTLP